MVGTEVFGDGVRMEKKEKTKVTCSCVHFFGSLTRRRR